MIFYLLPWSKKKSRMDIVKEDLLEVWKDRKGNRFDFLNDVRLPLIKEFGVSTSPLAPVWRRYKGKFWEELSFWALPSRVQQDIEDRALSLSPLMGMVGAGDLLPYEELSWKDRYEGKSLRNFWKEVLKPYTEKMFDSSVVFNFLSSEEKDVITLPENARVVSFEYIRKGKRVVNPLPHRAYTLRYIVEMKVDIDTLPKINFLDYKVSKVREDGNAIKVVMESEGKYI